MQQMPKKRVRPAEDEECTGMKDAAGDGEEYRKDERSHQCGPGNIAEIF